MKKIFTTFSFIVVGFLVTTSSFAEEGKTVKEEIKEAGRDTKRGTSKAVNTVKDKTCEMVNGKMECAMEKAKHGIENTADDVKDAAD